MRVVVDDLTIYTITTVNHVGMRRTTSTGELSTAVLRYSREVLRASKTKSFVTLTYEVHRHDGTLPIKVPPVEVARADFTTTK